MTDHSRIIISWLGLRRLIGIIGLLHPLILWIGGTIIFSTPLQSSMSAYYYTDMRDVFVGLGFVTGFFLLAYKGYDTHDRIVSYLAGFTAIIVALFPAAPAVNPTKAEQIIGLIHVGTAFIFLLALSYFCIVLFPKGIASTFTVKKRLRNTIYRACGATIIISLAVVGFYFAPTPLQPILDPYHPVFFGELIAFVAFGFAWLVKGQAILKDEN